MMLKQKFGGKTYEFHGSYGNDKKSARATAKSFRDGGYPARVVKADGEWNVYVRRTNRR